jgi:probable H4MPT-linked C1 transfer pathway protein
MLPESPQAGWIVGWDIGGAHLKVALADDRGRLHRVEACYTPLWQGLEHLDRALGRVLAGLPDAVHRVTMTAELVDLFEDRARGVAALSARIAARLPTDQVGIYAGPDGFVSPHSAAEHAERIASANWHATASLVARRLPDALLVDVGSTTTDIIPIIDARVRARGYTDRERLATQELLYTGVVRTSVMSLTDRVPLSGEWVGVAAEHFATMADVYRLTAELPCHADLGDTADGRDKTDRASALRLARMVGDDAGRHEPGVWRHLARYVRECQLTRIGQALARQCSLGLAEDAPLVGAGVGRFLVRRAARRQERPYLDLSELIDTDDQEILAERYAGTAAAAADCAPATAVALLAAGPNHATID